MPTRSGFPPESPSLAAGRPTVRLGDRARAAIRLRHLSPRTEEAYVQWMQRYYEFHGRQHPATLGAAHVTSFLNDLAVRRGVGASTQNQALAALVFLYREVLGRDLPWLAGLVRAKPSTRLPVVLSRDEVQALLNALSGLPKLAATLLYGSGLRLMECCSLRVKDVDFARDQITIRSGKGRKDRTTVLPTAASGELHAHLERVREAHRRDVANGDGWVALPDDVGEKSAAAGREWLWQWVFPATRTYLHAETGQPQAAPSARDGPPGRRPPRRRRGRHPQARHVPHSPPLLRHSPVGKRPRHPHRAEAAGPQRPEHHDDLHPRPELRRGTGDKPAGWALR